MTATDTEHGAADAITSKLRNIDRRLDGLAELVGSTDAEVASDAVRREADDLAAELRTLDGMVDLVGDDDPFASARVAVAIRRERLGFIRLALSPGEALPPPVQAPLPPSTNSGSNRSQTTEGDRAASTGRVFSIIGLVVVGFFIYQFTGSALVHHRQQKVLLQEFKEIAPIQAADPLDLLNQGGESGLLTPESAAGEDPLAADEEPAVIPAKEPPARGEPIGILQIPRIDVEQVVVQGSGPAELRAGPGHLRGTAMPGEPGNAVIAGSRLANGASFRQINVLEDGDPIDVTTALGRFRYEVRSVRRVKTGDPDPVRAKGGGSTLTLITSTPAFLAYDRLAVVAELQTRPVAPRFAPVTPDRSETGFDTAPGGLAPVIGWGAALGLAIAAARWLYRRWDRPIAYVLTTPVLVALVILVFESLGGLLPATF